MMSVCRCLNAWTELFQIWQLWPINGREWITYFLPPPLCEWCFEKFSWNNFMDDLGAITHESVLLESCLPVSLKTHMNKI